MKKTIISALMLLMAGAGLSAQNLDPTVVVTNTYSQQAGAVEKPSQLMEMPDSVMHFNLDFDYSALSVPYMGAYEFKPYLVELRPTTRPSGEGRLYLSAGAGYTLHPELTFIWTPVKKDYFKLNIYADHYSFIGNFGGAKGTVFQGSRLRSLVGANTLYTWTGGRLEADVRYRNVFAVDNFVPKSSNNAMDFRIKVESDPDASFYYIARNRSTVMNSPFGKEVHVDTKGGIGTRFGEHYLRLELGADVLSTTPGSTGVISVIPRYLFEHKDFSFDLGVKVAFLFRSSADYYNLSKYPWNFYFPLFPDVRITYCVVPDALALYARVTGGPELNTYEGLVDVNPFLASFKGVMDASVDRWNAAIGARGNIAARFRFDLKLGYTLKANAFLWGCEMDGETPLPSFGFVPKYHMFYTDVSLGWSGQHIDVDGNLLLRKTSLNENTLVAPPLLQGSAKVVYKWGGRIRAGVTFSGATKKISTVYTVPGYADLGLLGDIQMTRYLGLWLKAGNLLNQELQIIPFHAERGVYVTIGARLNL